MRTIWRSDEPPDPGDYPCEVCGQWPNEDECLCPQCPTCGAYGDPFCYREHGMVRSPEQVKSLAEAMEREAEEARRWDQYAEDWNADQRR